MRLAKVLFLLFWQILVFLPLAVHFGPLLGWQLFELLIAVTRLGALIVAQRSPVLHAGLQAILLLRCHAGVTLGDLQPLLPTRPLDIGPVVFKRRQDLLLLGIQLRPIRPAIWCGGLLSKHAVRECQTHQQQDYCSEGRGECSRSQTSNPKSV